MSEFKGPRVAQTIFSKKEKIEKFTLVNLNLLPAVVIKTLMDNDTGIRKF